MTAFLLYKKGRTGLTGRKLARVLGIHSGCDFTHSCDVLIRWGNSCNTSGEADTVLNSQSAVALASNKLKALELLKDAGITVPKVLGLDAKIPVYPILGRRRNHQQGKDIIVCHNDRDVRETIAQGTEYFVQYVHTLFEYRIHVFDDKIIKVSQKILTDPSKSIEWIRNIEYGYTFRKPQDPINNTIRRAAKKAVSTLGLHFGAVDLLIANNNIPVILEINTGPGLVATGIRKYAKHLALTTGLSINEKYLNKLLTIDANREEA